MLTSFTRYEVERDKQAMITASSPLDKGPMLLRRLCEGSTGFDVFGNTFVSLYLRLHEVDCFLRNSSWQANNTVQVANQVISWIDGGLLIIAL